MTRREYLDAIRGSLKGMSSTELSDIIRDFEEHFEIGLSQGKSEHEVSAELGDPVAVAQTYLDPELADIGHTAIENEDKHVPSAAEAVQIAKDDLTGPRVFVVLLNVLLAWWIALCLYAIILVFWCLTVAFLIGGILTLIMLATSAELFSAMLLTGIGLIALSVASAVFNFFLTKWTIIGSKAYIAWNKKIFHQGF